MMTRRDEIERGWRGRGRGCCGGPGRCGAHARAHLAGRVGGYRQGTAVTGLGHLHRSRFHRCLPGAAVVVGPCTYVTINVLTTSRRRSPRFATLRVDQSREQMLRSTTLHRWGKVELSAVTRRDVEAWVAELIAAGAQPDVVRRAVDPLRAICRLAIEEGALGADPTTRVRLPRPPKRHLTVLTVEQVEALAREIEHPVYRPAGHGARAAAPSYRPDLALAVRLAAYGGASGRRAMGAPSTVGGPGRSGAAHHRVGHRGERQARGDPTEDRDEQARAAAGRASRTPRCPAGDPARRPRCLTVRRAERGARAPPGGLPPPLHPGCCQGWSAGHQVA